MITLAGHLIACLFWGLLIALTLTGICILIARSYTNKGVNPLICIVLSIFILYQSVLAVGAMYAKGLVQDIHDTVENVAETAGGMLSSNEISSKFNHVTSRYDCRAVYITTQRIHIKTPLLGIGIHGYRDNTFNHLPLWWQKPKI